METEVLNTHKPKVLPFGEDLGGAFNYRNSCEAYSAPIVYSRGINQEETSVDDNIINNDIAPEVIYNLSSINNFQ